MGDESDALLHDEGSVCGRLVLCVMVDMTLVFAGVRRHVRDVPRLPLCLHAHTYVYICTDTGWRVGLGRQGGVSMPMPLRDSNDSLNSSTLCLLPAAPV